MSTVEAIFRYGGTRGKNGGTSSGGGGEDTIYTENVLESKNSASGTNAASINYTVETAGQYIIVYASRINTTGGTRTLSINDEAQTLVTWHSTTGWNINAYAWVGALNVGDVVTGRYAVSGASSNGATSIWIARLYNT